MRSDFEIIQHHFPAREDITIIPVSDVHLGAAEHMADEWREFVNTVKRALGSNLHDMGNNAIEFLSTYYSSKVAYNIIVKELKK